MLKVRVLIQLLQQHRKLDGQLEAKSYEGRQNLYRLSSKKEYDYLGSVWKLQSHLYDTA